MVLLIDIPCSNLPSLVLIFMLEILETVLVFRQKRSLGNFVLPSSLTLSQIITRNISLIQVLYTLGGLENLQTAKKYYASTIDLTGGKNTKALFGICLVSFLWQSSAYSNLLYSL